MKTNLIQIGNSKGIRIPKSLIEQYGAPMTTIIRQDAIDQIRSLDKGRLVKNCVS